MRRIGAKIGSATFPTSRRRSAHAAEAQNPDERVHGESLPQTDVIAHKKAEPQARRACGSGFHFAADPFEKEPRGCERVYVLTVFSQYSMNSETHVFASPA